MHPHRTGHVDRTPRTWYAILLVVVAAYQALTLDAVAGPILPTTPPRTTFVLEAHAPDTSDGTTATPLSGSDRADAPIEILISDVVIDGARVSPLVFGNGLPHAQARNAFLHYVGPAADFRIAVEARHVAVEVVAETPRGGRYPSLALRRGDSEPVWVDVGALARTRWVRTYTYRPPPRHWFAAPTTETPGWLLPAAFGVLLLLGAALRPWRYPVVYLLLHLVGIHALVASTLPGNGNSDTAGYVGAVEDILQHGCPAYFPPGYPILIAGLDLLPLRLGDAVSWLQHALAVAAGVWLYRLLARGTTTFVALAGALLGATTATTLLGARISLTESLTASSLVGLSYFAWLARERGTVRPAVVSGLFAGLATLLRFVPIGVAVPLLLLPLARGPRRGLRSVVAGVAALLVMLAPFSLTFWWNGYGPSLSTSGPGHLFNRVVYGQGLVDRDAPATRELLERLDREDEPLRAREHMIVRERLVATGLTPVEAVSLQGRVALEAVRRHPLRFASGTAASSYELLQATSPQYLVPLSAAVPPPAIATATTGTSAEAMTFATTLLSFESAYWPLVAAFALLGAALALRDRAGPLLLAAFVGFGMLVLAAAGENVIPRYAMPSVPLLCGLAAHGALGPLTARRRTTRVVDLPDDGSEFGGPATSPTDAADASMDDAERARGRTPRPDDAGGPDERRSLEPDSATTRPDPPHDDR